MAIILRPKIIKIDDFFQFDNNDDPVQIVDIINDPTKKSSNQSDFLSTPGSFVYSSEFYVDNKKAEELSIKNIKFDFFLRKPSDLSLPVRGASFLVELSQDRESTVLFDKRLGSDSAALRASPGKTKEIIVMSSLPMFGDIANSLKNITITNNSDRKQSGNFRQDAKDSETKRKIDTAAVMSSGMFNLTTPNRAVSMGMSNSRDTSSNNANFEKISYANLASGASISQKRNESRDERRGNQNNNLLNSHDSLTRTKNTNLSETFTDLKRVQLSTTKSEFLRHFSFDKSLLQGVSTIFLRISADLENNTSNTIIESKIVEIYHDKEVEHFLHCPEPPIVKILESTMSRTSFHLTKTDTTLKSVRVVRVIKNPNMTNPITESRSMINFGNDQEIVYEDDVDNIFPNLVIYRFIVVNNDDSLGEFTSVVLDQNIKISDKKKEDTAKTPITIRALNKRDYVDVSVDILTNDVYSIRLLRQDCSLTGDFSDTIAKVSGEDQTYETFVNNERTTLQYKDYNTAPGRHYRYFCAYRLGSGMSAAISRECLSDEDENIVRRIESDDLPFTPTISNPTISQIEDGTPSVLFDLESTETKNGFNVLFESLRIAGVSSQFLQDLQNDRQKIKQVSAFLIERIDKRTGKRESFGIYSPGKFEDSNLERRKKNVSDPVPGRKYEYVFKMCIRPPESFLLTALVGFTASQDLSGVTTQKLAARFQGSLSSRGILPSDSHLRNDVSIEENFSSGQTGVEISKIVSFPKSDPVIKNFRIMSKKNYNILSWSLSGNLSNIGYCLIYCNYNGRDELLGAVSATGFGAGFKYKDDRYTSEVGYKKYKIVLMTNENERSIESSYVESVTFSSSPLIIFDGHISAESNTRDESVIIPVKFDPTGIFRNILDTQNAIKQEIPAEWSSIVRAKDGSLVSTEQTTKKSLSDNQSYQIENDFNFGRIRK